MKYAIYDLETGEINRVVSCNPELISSQVGPTESIFTGDANDSTQYILNNDVINRPMFNISLDKTTVVANSVDCAVISGIPQGAIISSGDVSSEADGSNVEFHTDISGQHTITISMFPYIDERLVIDAV